MDRRRVALALLFDRATTERVDQLRAAYGEDDLDRIPVHMTLVPPVDLPAGEVDTAWAAAAATAATEPGFDLVLGPAETFAPRTMTLHLAVTGDVERLAALRSRLRRPPLPQRERWPFVPHVTLRQETTIEVIERGLDELRDLHLRVRADELTLLEHLPRPGHARRGWSPVADARFDG